MEEIDIKYPEAEIENFNNYQSKIYFSKADGGYPVGMELPHREKHAEHIKKIFQDKMGISVANVDEYPRRTLHYVYKATAQDSSSYVVRINASSEFYREFQFITEAWVMNKLAGLDLPALKVHVVDLSREIVPFDYEIIEKARGKTMFDLVKENNLTTNHLRMLGKFMAKFHTIKTEKFGLFGAYDKDNEKVIGLDKSWKDYIFKNLNKHIETCVILDVFDAKIADRIQKLFNSVNKLNLEEGASLLYGDAAMHNVFCDGSEITGLIDWEDCLSGDPIYDIAYFGSSSYGRSDLFESFLTGYKEVRQLPYDFWKRYWLYFLRISIMKAVVRQRFGSRSERSLIDVQNRILLALSEASGK